VSDLANIILMFRQEKEYTTITYYIVEMRCDEIEGRKATCALPLMCTVRSFSSERNFKGMDR